MPDLRSPQPGSLPVGKPRMTNIERQKTDSRLESRERMGEYWSSPIARLNEVRTSTEETESSKNWSRLEDFLFDSVDFARRDRREEISTGMVDRYLLELERLIQGMRDSLMDTPSLDEFLRHLDGILDERSRTDSTAGSKIHQGLSSSDGQVGGRTEQSVVPSTGVTLNVVPGGGRGQQCLQDDRPYTRSRGPVRDTDWVMLRALEHSRKGRPRRRR